MTNLRRKMLEELQLRNYSPHTQRAYIRWVAKFAQHFKATPDNSAPTMFVNTNSSWSRGKSSRGRLQSNGMCAAFFLPSTCCIGNG